MLIREEFGRSYQSPDQVGNNNWENNEDVQVETIADSYNNKWLVSVTCSSYPEFSLPQRAFEDEQSAQFYSREQSEKIRNQILNLPNPTNESMLREAIRKIILSV